MRSCRLLTRALPLARMPTPPSSAMAASSSAFVLSSMGACRYDMQICYASAKIRSKVRQVAGRHGECCCQRTCRAQAAMMINKVTTPLLCKDALDERTASLQSPHSLDQTDIPTHNGDRCPSNTHYATLIAHMQQIQHPSLQMHSRW
jgi:hypothetical protein